MYLVESETANDGSSASVTGLLAYFFIWVDSLQTGHIVLCGESHFFKI